MQTNKRLPKRFSQYSDDPILTNLDAIVNREIKDAIQRKELYSTFAAYDFYSYVWWDLDTSQWNGEVWEDKKYVASYEATNLEDLANEINKNHSMSESVRF